MTKEKGAHNQAKDAFAEMVKRNGLKRIGMTQRFRKGGVIVQACYSDDDTCRQLYSDTNYVFYPGSGIVYPIAAMKQSFTNIRIKGADLATIKPIIDGTASVNDLKKLKSLHAWGSSCVLQKEMGSPANLFDFERSTADRLIEKTFMVQRSQSDHVDHLIPISWFDPDVPGAKEFCESRKNKGVKTRKENLEKSNRYADCPRDEWDEAIRCGFIRKDVLTDLYDGSKELKIAEGVLT